MQNEVENAFTSMDDAKKKKLINSVYDVKGNYKFKDIVSIFMKALILLSALFSFVYTMFIKEYDYYYNGKETYIYGYEYLIVEDDYKPRVEFVYKELGANILSAAIIAPAEYLLNGWVARIKYIFVDRGKELIDAYGGSEYTREYDEYYNVPLIIDIYQDDNIIKRPDDAIYIFYKVYIFLFVFGYLGLNIARKRFQKNLYLSQLGFYYIPYIFIYSYLNRNKNYYFYAGILEGFKSISRLKKEDVASHLFDLGKNYSKHLDIEQYKLSFGLVLSDYYYYRISLIDKFTNERITPDNVEDWKLKVDNLDKYDVQRQIDKINSVKENKDQDINEVQDNIKKQKIENEEIADEVINKQIEIDDLEDKSDDFR